MGLIGEDEKFEHAYAYVALFSIHVFFLSINLKYIVHNLSPCANQSRGMVQYFWFRTKAKLKSIGIRIHKSLLRLTNFYPRLEANTSIRLSARTSVATFHTSVATGHTFKLT